MNEQNSLEDEDLFSKTESRIFSILFPLFHHPKKPNAFISAMLWVIFCIQMVAVALFRIDNSTQAQTALSKVVNFVDLSSLSIMIGKNSIFLVLGFLILIILLFAILLICSFLFHSILVTQPWIITLVRILHEILLLQINDTGEEIKTSVWRAASDNICMGNIYQIVGVILAIITFIVLIVYCGALDLLIFNFNPKNGGLFSCPDGFFNFIQHLFILSLIPWIIFGSVRLCSEIGYLFEGRFNSYLPQIILILFIVYDCVYKIAKFEAKARTSYEDLLSEQPNNVTVLKQYASLLNDIYSGETISKI
ncbi:MAG: hypothetical protein EZS28_004266 [Streblomastix strix]|uniref:Uncharacterized protein n=1 Tax=Streblomastix strix TaxID=222440 RepID=A0A5J4X0S1_9EUKA|nr:MAG: hypothetical protein EZS28_004266 [Streblomastix strix]